MSLAGQFDLFKLKHSGSPQTFLPSRRSFLKTNRKWSTGLQSFRTPHHSPGPSQRYAGAGGHMSSKLSVQYPLPESMKWAMVEIFTPLNCSWLQIRTSGFSSVPLAAPRCLISHAVIYSPSPDCIFIYHSFILYLLSPYYVPALWSRKPSTHRIYVKTAAQRRELTCADTSDAALCQALGMRGETDRQGPRAHGVSLPSTFKSARAI